jgi:cell division protein FtsB
MNKTQLQELVQECIAEVLDERFTNEGYDEFQRADKGSKGVAAKDKAEEDTYGAGYAAGEKAAKAKYKKLAEAYKALKEEMSTLDEARFKKGEDIGEPGPGFKKVAKAAEKQYGSKEAGQKVAGAILKKVLAKKK